MVSIVYYISNLDNPIYGHYYCNRRYNNQWLHCDDTVCQVQDNIDENLLNTYLMVLEKV